jgi:hypothetical protein
VLRRWTLALALLALPIAAAAQQPQTAIDFLKSIYEPYRSDSFKGQPYWEPRRFFAPDLAAAIERDFAEAKKRQEVPTLDGDPFLNAQDWQITGISYATSLAKDGKTAAGAVSFLNTGAPRAVALSLVDTPSGWRISDIVDSSGSLRALFKLK